MQWPGPGEYTAAVQNPMHCFSDAELRAGTVHLNPMGLPISVSGGFVTVFRVQCGHRTYAVRCFLREVADQQQRYAAISTHLARLQLPYFAGFEYLPQGILVRGQWYPVVKMEWVAGESLAEFVHANLHRPSRLRRLASRSLAMLEAMEEAGIAHGDLQIGNVVICADEPRLIDYDGMFVPALAGLHSLETGHRHFQHPARTAKHYGPYLDRFSGRVIYLSLLAVAEDPELWPHQDGGVEHLLLTQEDFRHPECSPLLQRLLQVTDHRIRQLAAELVEALRATPEQISRLSTFVGKRVTGLRAPAQLPDWIRPHVRDELEELVRNLDCELPQLDVTPPQREVSPETACPPVQFETSADEALLWILFILSTLPFSLIDPIILVMIVLFIFFFVIHISLRYVTREKVGVRCRTSEEQIQRVVETITAHSSRVDEIRRLLHGNDKRVVVLHTEYSKRLDMQQFVQDGRRHAECGAIEARLDEVQWEIEHLEEYCQEIQEVRDHQLHLLHQEMESIEARHQEEEKEALRLLRDRYVNDFLRKHTLELARIPNVGRATKSWLLSWGFLTALDIDDDILDFEYISLARRRAVLEWRDRLADRAASQAPCALPRDVDSAIAETYQRERAGCERRLATVKSAAELRMAMAQQQYGPELDRLKALREQLKCELEACEVRLRAEVEAARAALVREFAREIAGIRAEVAKLQSEGLERMEKIKALKLEAHRLTAELEALRRLTLWRYLGHSLGLRVDKNQRS